MVFNLLMFLLRNRCHSNLWSFVWVFLLILPSLPPHTPSVLELSEYFIHAVNFILWSFYSYGIGLFINCAVTWWGTLNLKLHKSSLTTFLTHYICKKRYWTSWIYPLFFLSILSYFHFYVFYFLLLVVPPTSWIFQCSYWRSFIQYNIWHLMMGNLPLRVRGQVSMSLRYILSKYAKKHLNTHLKSSTISLPTSTILLSGLNSLYGVSLVYLSYFYSCHRSWSLSAELF